MKYNDIIKEVSQELNIPEKVVASAYKSMYEFIRSKIIELPLREDLTEEDFNKLRTNFNIPALGKFNCTYDKYLRVNRRFDYLRNKQNEVKED